MIYVCRLFVILYQHKMEYSVMDKNKNPLFVCGYDRKNLSPFSLVMLIGDPLDGLFYYCERGVFQVRLLAWLEAFAHMR